MQIYGQGRKAGDVGRMLDQASNEVCVDLRILVNLHLLHRLLEISVKICQGQTHHFKVVDLLPDLLGQQRRQAIACRDLAASIILATGPGLVELDTRAEHNVPSGHRLGGDWCTLRLRSRVPTLGREEVIFSCDFHRVRVTMDGARRFIGGSRGTGVRRVGNAVERVDRRRNIQVRVRFYVTS